MVDELIQRGWEAAMRMNIDPNVASTRAGVQGTHKVNHAELYGVGLDIQFRVVGKQLSEFRIRRDTSRLTCATSSSSSGASPSRSPDAAARYLRL